MKQSTVTNQGMTYRSYEEALEDMYFLEIKLLEEEYKMKQCGNPSNDGFHA